MTPFPRAAIVALLAAAAAPSSSSSSAAVDGSSVAIVDLSRDDLPSNAAAASSPGSVAVRDAASGDPLVRAAIVLERGGVVADYVRDDVDPSVPRQAWSATKSWTSLLIGIMVDEYLVSIDETLGEVFADREDAWDDADAETVDFRRNVTIEEMLAMTSGLITPPELWDEAFDGPDDFEELLTTSGGGSSLRDALAYPGVGTRGAFSYLAISNILSYVVLERTGMTPREYLARKVMVHLGIDEDDYGWRRNEEGVEFAFHGLELTPVQMAKFGQLYLQGGVAGPPIDGEERRVVSRGWIDDSFSVQSVDDETGSPVGYGYLFWKAGSAFCALGLFGQDICVDRDLERVVVQQRDPDYGDLLADDFVVGPVALDPTLSFDAPLEGVNSNYRSAVLAKAAGGVRARPMIAAAAAFVLGFSMLKCSAKLWGRSHGLTGYDAIQ